MCGFLKKKKLHLILNYQIGLINYQRYFCHTLYIRCGEPVAHMPEIFLGMALTIQAEEQRAIAFLSPNIWAKSEFFGQ